MPARIRRSIAPSPRPALASAVNGRAPGILADEAKRDGAVLIHYSTDYVFDGARATPYPEEAPTAPLNVYGATKLEGERAIAAVGGHALVFRTSWVYGLRGRNFLLTVRRLAAERDELSIVADQIGVPNWSRALAEATVRVVGAGLPAAAERAGLYHLSAAGRASWYEFARAIVGDAQRPRVVPITTAEYPTPARRPAYGVLATQRFETTFGFALAEMARNARALHGESEERAADSRRSECEATVDGAANGELAALSGDDDRVHSERDALQRGAHPVAGERGEGLAADPCGVLIGRRHLAARARLDELQRDAVGA